MAYPGVARRPNGTFVTGPQSPRTGNDLDFGNPEWPYWVGFLMADGSIRRRGDRPDSWAVQVSVAMVDADHLRRLANLYRPGYSITKRPARVSTMRDGSRIKSGESVHLSIGSKALAAFLQEHGVTPNKTKHGRVVGYDQNRDFWRGVIDGDGSITSATRRGLPLVTVCGSSGLMGQLACYVQTVSASFIGKPRLHRGTTYLSFAGVHAQRMVAELWYPGCVCLPRKEVFARAVLAYTPRRFSISDAILKKRVQSVSREGPNT